VTFLPRRPGGSKRRLLRAGAGTATLDLPTLLELFDGDRSGVGALLAAAIAAIARDARELETRATAGDRAGVVETAHRLKGTGGTIGAKRLVAAASKIERAQPVAVPKLLSDVRTEVAALAAEIDAYRAGK
jgi:HPt (histidine-containing phosphotransfer) domain-containing protein